MLVHDYLTQRGGAERVLRVLSDTFPTAPVYTSLYEPDATYPEFRTRDIRTLWTNRARTLRRDHRRGLPLYGPAFAALRLDADVVVCSSSGWAHLVRSSGAKLVYCYNPARWLYADRDAYLAGFPRAVRLGLVLAGPLFRSLDRSAARRADRYLAISEVVRGRIQRAYGIESEVVPPPLTIDPEGPQQPIDALQPGFDLCVSRLLAYKRVALIVEAYRALPQRRLVIVGSGPELEAIRRGCGRNVRLIEHASDSELRWLYENSSTLVAASDEDFGLTPVEAAAFGKPAVVLRSGGYLETVVEGRTGVFFDEPEPSSIAAAIREMAESAWDPSVLRAHADGFGESAFSATVRERVDALRR